MLDGVLNGSQEVGGGDVSSLTWEGRSARPEWSFQKAATTKQRTLEALRALTHWAPTPQWRRGLSPQRSETVITAILFTDLADAARRNAVRSQEAFRAHHRLLSGVVQLNGGREVKWLGDGLMVAFSSVSDALQAAVAMQQAARWPVDGIQLAVRVGLDVGETLRENRDHFGTTVVVARRLCDRAEGGQILCSALFADLLGRRKAFPCEPRGELGIDGIAAAVEAREVLYEDRRGRGAWSNTARRRLRASLPRMEEGDVDGPAPNEAPPPFSGGQQGETASVVSGARRLLRWIKSRSIC
jgi:class 3 adenylate cyclase